MKRIYKVEILSEIIVETNGSITPDEIMQEITPTMHIKPSKSGRYRVANYQSDSNIHEIDEENREIMKV